MKAHNRFHIGCCADGQNPKVRDIKNDSLEMKTFENEILGIYFSDAHHKRSTKQSVSLFFLLVLIRWIEGGGQFKEESAIQ